MSAGDPSAHTPELRVLDRDLTRFLVYLSIALHRFAIYPHAHPALALALDILGRHLEVLLQNRPKIAIGVAGDRLVIEGVVTDERQPLLSSLADRLHRHQLSALAFCPGTTIDELQSVVAAIARDPAGEAGPIGRQGGMQGMTWPHITLHPLTVGSLEIVEGGGEEDEARGCRSAELWVGLAQAALGRDDAAGSAPGSVAPVLEPALVARAIDEHQPVEAYDQVIVGYLQQIADETRTAHTPEATELRRRVSTLVSSMHPDTLRRLLAMGGDGARRREFVSAATAGVSAGAVVDLVQAAAAASNSTLSHGLVRLLGKLAAHAEGGMPEVQPLADAALRLQVQTLTTGWDLQDPNPEDYTGLLDRITQEAPRGAAGAPEPDRQFGDPFRVVLMCLELNEEGPALRHAVGGLVGAGQLVDALRLLEFTVGGEPLELKAWKAIASAETLRQLLERDPPDFSGVDALLPHLHGEALAPLFVTLVESDDVHVRRAAFNCLNRAGPDAAALALARLATEERWFAVRNLLALLVEAKTLPAGCDPMPWLAHEHGHVRREALRLALRFRNLRDRALAAALADTDERVLNLALRSVLLEPARGVARQLFDLIGRETLSDELRALGIEALVRVNRGPEVADRLLEFVTRDFHWLGWGDQETRSRTSIAALSALATHWRDNRQVAAIVRRAAASRSPDVRLAVESVWP
jgi:hypothetical protein